MKFSRLKITGFKSFCDESELQFETGLTGIVGPNGCGKSNLVEALRWVMGESSYKAMRASGMDDVIFSGSANRPSRNNAEVALILDNSDRNAPAALNDADILEISRRIERESGSAYRVNGREVRARDVQLLFADASTGAKSPALVRQGQIGELIAAKPVKRRAILEEAAGISGLHSRRHEAELRLRATEQNLERVDDVVAQIEEQLANLKRQARQATRYRNVSGDIRKSEALLYHIRWVGARHEHKNSEALQGQLINKLADATHKEQIANKTHKENDARLTPLREIEVKFGASLQRLKILKEQLEQELRRAGNRKIELEDRKKQIDADNQREQNLITEANEIIAKANLEKTQLEKQNASEQQDIEAARLKSSNIKQKLENVERKAGETANRLAEFRAKRHQAEKSLSDVTQKLNGLKQQSKDVVSELENIETDLQKDEAVKQHQANLEKANIAFEMAEKASIKAEENVALEQTELEKTRPDFTKVQAELSTLESEAATLARVLNVEGGSLWPSIVDKLSVKAGYESAIGAALGEDLEASTDNGAPIYWDEPASSKDDAPLPEAAIPLSEFVSGSKLLNRRLLQTGLVDKNVGFNLMQQLKTGQRLVSLEGDLWRWDGFIAHADAPTASVQRMAQRNRLKELDIEVKDAKISCAKFEEKIAKLNNALNISRAKEQSEKQKWRQAQHEISSTQNLLDIAQKSLSELTSRKSALIEAQTRIDNDIKQSQLEITSSKELLDNETGEEEITNINLQLQEELNDLRKEYESAQFHLNEFENSKNLRLSRLNQINIEINNWQRRKNDAENQFKILSDRLNEIISQLEIIYATPDGFAKKQKAIDENIEIASADYKTASDRLNEAQNLFRDSEKEVRTAIEELSNVKQELARVEERLKAHLIIVQQIEQITQENLAIPVSQTAKLAQINSDSPLPDELVVEKRLERLKIERERLGGVNLGAEHEAKEIKQKLEIMIDDKDDLIGAISKLRHGISSLNKEGRARLNDAFDKVNSHFKTLFTTLFGGGEAELAFVESDDPLEAGLEIIARPPGKKPQILTLLSGGEQALTALSLIFAVFLTNPAPICVLDEVDAPLDDANVERFCNLLDEMCERTNTRFVIVTHNPITMSRCDRLFGVTMAERGVSQIVSVDLLRAREVAEAG